MPANTSTRHKRGMVRVLFVCLGNICRSPTAEAVFRHQVEAAGLTGHVHIDSAGTSDWHVGTAPDQRAQAAAKRRGFDMSGLRARAVCPDDFEAFDLILAMDHTNLAKLTAMSPRTPRSETRLLLSFATGIGQEEVPDPYYGGDEGFARVIDMIENASEGLLAHVRERLSAP